MKARRSLLRRYRKVGTDYLSNNTIGYAHSIIFIDALIKRTSELSGKSETEIRYSLYSGYLRGDHSALRVFKETFGVNALSYLSILDDSHSSWMYIEIVAKKFGFKPDEIEQMKIKAQDYVENKKPINIMGGIII